MPSPATGTERMPMSWDEYLDCDIGDRRAVPHPAVEILSTEPTHDTVTKFGKYAEVGRFGPTDEADLDLGPARVRHRGGDLLP